MASAERRRKTHILCLLACLYDYCGDVLYLAPMTTVLLLNTYFSNSTNMPPGNVPKGPVNSASVTKVPNSASKRSRRGVRATMLKIRWSQLRCIRGKAFRRCTAERPCISAVHKFFLKP
jgi:hypothetical protein